MAGSAGTGGGGLNLLPLLKTSVGLGDLGGRLFLVDKPGAWTALPFDFFKSFWDGSGSPGFLLLSIFRLGWLAAALKGLGRAGFILGGLGGGFEALSAVGGSGAGSL